MQQRPMTLQHPGSAPVNSGSLSQGCLNGAARGAGTACPAGLRRPRPAATVIFVTLLRARMSSSTPVKSRGLLGRLLDIEGESEGSRVAASFYDYETETSWSFRGDSWFHAASTMKVAVLLGLFAASGQGRFGLSSNLHVRNRFFSVVDGKPFCLEYERDSGSAVYASLGKTMKLLELARHMIATSNNLATNLLLELIGVEQVGATLAELGVDGVAVRRGVEDTKAYDAGVNNTVTANGLLSMFRVIQEGRGFPAEDAQRMLEIL